ncbi:MAG: phenylacetate--CoA ligase family protein [Armatimonadetes bacterium]|nr:phenylacetate--CoA ligase family protein [Armatimonadota bacterium]
MSVGERARALAYWTLDRLRGGRVAFHYRDLAKQENEPTLLAERQTQRLQQLLSHACQTTTYYKQFAGATELSQFPVLQKRVIRERHADFLSSAYTSDSLTTRTTSGSYGTPLAFHLTREKMLRHQAEIIYYARWAGYEVGCRHVQTRFMVIPGPLKLWALNRRVMNPTSMTEEWLSAQRDMLRNQPIKFIVSFPSVLAGIASYCKASGDTPADYRLQGIIATAEQLREDARALIEATFGCPVLSRYTAEELGILAQECPTARQHHLNGGSHVIEVLERDRNIPAAAGQAGRIVVTDLWSHAMPLIRYELGDVGVMGGRCACGWDGPVLTEIQGRLAETIYDAEGNRLVPFVINHAMGGIDRVVQYQFVQHEQGRYTMRLCVMPGFAQEDVVRERLLHALGSQAKLGFEYVEDIPPLRSGKRPYIVNEMASPNRTDAT